MPWLVKTEPDVYSIDDFARDKCTFWDGVRNYQARNFLRDDFKVGDEVLVYHSNCEPTGVVGLAQVAKVGLPDLSQFDKSSEYYDAKATQTQPTWFAPQLRFVRRFAAPVTLEQLRATPKLVKLAILRRGNRLSVTPVSSAELQIILGLAGAK